MGCLHADHRWPLAIEAWRRVAPNWPHARLWLIGDGPQREELYRRIRDADLYGRVLLPGEFDATEDLLQAADLLISPLSAPKESLAVLEAMGAGLPVVACEGTYPELLIDGVTGFVVKPRDASALATTIARALHHPLQRDACAAAALKRVRETRRLTTMATTHLKLFQQLVSSPARLVK
jgi:glycosyltransferase involved in cell wall biosynthesis